MPTRKKIRLRDDENISSFVAFQLVQLNARLAAVVDLLSPDDRTKYREAAKRHYDRRIEAMPRALAQKIDEWNQTTPESGGKVKGVRMFRFD